MTSQLKISEKCLEDLLFELLKSETGRIDLWSRGLQIHFGSEQQLFRQLDLRGYGIPDIVAIYFTDATIKVSIIELKVTEFDLSNLIQLGRYTSGIRNFVEKKFPNNDRRILVNSILIVNGFNDEEDYTWIGSLLDSSVSVYDVSYRVDGIRFCRVLPGGWCMPKTDIDLQDYPPVDLSDLKSSFKSAFKNGKAF